MLPRRDFGSERSEPHQLHRQAGTYPSGASLAAHDATNKPVQRLPTPVAVTLALVARCALRTDLELPAVDYAVLARTRMDADGRRDW